MTAFHRSLRFRLFFWYVASLLLLGLFIISTVHIYRLPYSSYLLIVLFLLLSLIGFLIIHGFTRSLILLSTQIHSISSKNLDERVASIKRNDEIGELAAAFNALLDRLDTAFKRERQFIADVAHELKTPLSTLRSSFEVTLQKSRSNEEYKKIMTDSITETDRLAATLKDVLDLTWAQTPHEGARKTFDLSEMLEGLGEIAQKLAIKKHIAVNWSITPRMNMRGFRDRLGRAILNIIDNAVKYTPAQGHVHITAIKEQHNVLITIKDTGCGIEKSELAHIFDRFYRGSKSQSVFGAGLGLAIALSTIKIHGGAIRVKSTPRVGSTFTIALPLS